GRRRSDGPKGHRANVAATGQVWLGSEAWDGEAVALLKVSVGRELALHLDRELAEVVEHRLQPKRDGLALVDGQHQAVVRQAFDALLAGLVAALVGRERDVDRKLRLAYWEIDLVDTGVGRVLAIKLLAAGGG